jgi:hypothetical protein
MAVQGKSEADGFAPEEVSWPAEADSESVKGPGVFGTVAVLAGRDEVPAVVGPAFGLGDDMIEVGLEG